MRLNEPNAQLRRIFFVIRTEDGDIVVDDDAITGLAADDLQTSANGVPFVNADGTLGRDGALHYYEASPDDASIPGFVAVVFDRPGFQIAHAWAPVGHIFALGETDETLLRYPLTIEDDGEPPSLVEGATAAAAELQTSLNATGFANAAGTLEEVGKGLYFYQGAAPDAATEGARAIKFEKAGYAMTIAWVPIAEEAGGGEAPVIDMVSPTPGIPAGDPGGFPNDDTAFRTPVVIEIDAPDGVALAVVVLRYRDELDVERCVYRRGKFRRGFAAESYDEIDGDVLRLHIIPDTAWRVSSLNVLDDLVFDVDAVGGSDSSLSDIGASS